MGSLWGHLDEGIVFAAVGWWWTYNLLKQYINVGSGKEYKSYISYDVTIRKKKIPVEIYGKIFFSIGGFLIEAIGAKFEFIDEHGNVTHVSNLQHMSIFLLFLLHAVLDVLRFFKLLYIEGLEYLTMAFAFIWYGIVFYFHTQGHTDPVETVIHSLGILWCFGSGLSILWEYRSEEKFLPNYCRCIMVMSLGTWFIHMPFVMYSTQGFPGKTKNPKWDRFDQMNVQFIATMVGFHLFFNITSTVILYVVMKCRFKCVGKNKDHVYEMVPNGGLKLKEENSYLLDDEDEEL